MISKGIFFLSQSHSLPNTIIYSMQFTLGVTFAALTIFWISILIDVSYTLKLVVHLYAIQIYKEIIRNSYLRRVVLGELDVSRCQVFLTML